ncbi:uncharacterized protein TNCV_1808501 [Trichonephila clavipes]|nr:uncharacterized protein TNCV_1808501 [Trichonephila clavipes]
MDGWPARSPDLSSLDFFLWGHMKSLVYASPVDFDEALVGRIAVVAGEIREMPGVFANVRHSLRRWREEVVAAVWSTTPRSGVTELCSEGREFQISPPEHNSVCAT